MNFQNKDRNIKHFTPYDSTIICWEIEPGNQQAKELREAASEEVRYGFLDDIEFDKEEIKKYTELRSCNLFNERRKFYDEIIGEIRRHKLIIQAEYQKKYGKKPTL